jgi:hypothetical protein
MPHRGSRSTRARRRGSTTPYRIHKGPNGKPEGIARWRTRERFLHSSVHTARLQPLAPSMRSHRTLVVSSLLLTLAACHKSNPLNRPVPGARGGTIQPVGSARGSATASSKTQLTRREVIAKEEPATLYANDRSHCKVTPDRFKEIAVGERVWCNWEDTRNP